MIDVTINYSDDSASELYEAIKNQMYSNERSETFVELKGNQLIFRIKAKDIIAAKASFNGITQIIQIKTKMDKVMQDE